MDGQAVWNLIEAGSVDTLGPNPRVDLIREEMEARLRPGNTRTQQTVLSWLARQANRPIDVNFTRLMRQYLHQWPAPAEQNADPETVLELFRGYPLDGNAPPLFVAIRRELPYIVRWMLDILGAHPLQRANPNTILNGISALDNAVNMLFQYSDSSVQGGPAPETQMDMVFLLMAAGANPLNNAPVFLFSSQMIVSHARSIPTHTY